LKIWGCTTFFPVTQLTNQIAIEILKFIEGFSPKGFIFITAGQRPASGYEN
jgi:hypothetical protein